MIFLKYFKKILIQISSLFYFNKKSKVIFYHDIHDLISHTCMSTPIDLFKEHISIIRNEGYEIVNDITSEYGQIEICFDDGYQGIYDNIDYLKKNKIFIHLFIITSNINKKGFLNNKQLEELNNLNLITISSHTHQHKIATSQSHIDFKNDLIISKNYLQNLTNTNINSLCYPLGYYSQMTNNIAKEVGFQKLYTCLPGFYLRNSPLNRSLVQFSQRSEFKAILKGGDHILSIWYKLKYFKR